MYPDTWGYNDSWGSTWIEEHDAVGKQIGKPVILEEYGSPFPHNHTLIEAPWQDTVLSGGLAADMDWQFGTPDLSVDVFDVNTIFINDTEFAILGSGHAQSMLAKVVG